MPTASGGSSPAWSPRPSPSPPATPPSWCRRAPPATSCGASLERILLGPDRPALCLPHLATRADLLHLFRQRLVAPPGWLSPFDREVILARGAAEAAAAGLRAAVCGPPRARGGDAGALRRAAPPAPPGRPLRGVPHRRARALRRPRRRAAAGPDPVPGRSLSTLRGLPRGAPRRRRASPVRAADRRAVAAADAAGDRHGHRSRRRPGGAVALGLRSAGPAAGPGPTRRRGHRGQARRRLARARVRGAAGHRGSAGAAGPR